MSQLTAKVNSNILLQWCCSKVFVRKVCSFQQFLKILKTNVKSDGHANGGPQRVTAAHPIPKAKHVILVNPKRHTFFFIGRQRHKMLGNMCRVLCMLEEPLFGRHGIHEGLLGGERLGCYNKQYSLRIELLEHLGHMSAVNIGHEMNLERAAVRFQRLGDHERAQIGTTNANVDYVGDGKICVAKPLATSHQTYKRLHAFEYRVHVIHHI